MTTVQLLSVIAVLSCIAGLLFHWLQRELEKGGEE